MKTDAQKLADYLRENPERQEQLFDLLEDAHNSVKDNRRYIAALTATMHAAEVKTDDLYIINEAYQILVYNSEREDITDII